MALSRIGLRERKPRAVTVTVHRAIDRHHRRDKETSRFFQRRGSRGFLPRLFKLLTGVGCQRDGFAEFLTVFPELPDQIDYLAVEIVDYFNRSWRLGERERRRTANGF